MAFYDNSQQFTAVDDALDRYYNLDAVPQFQRLGKTARWFNPRGVAMKGKSYGYVAWTQPATGVRRETFTTGRISEFPAARDLDYQPLSVSFADMKLFRATSKINILDWDKTKDPKHAVADLAMKVLSEADMDFASQLNVALYQAGTCGMGTIKQIYDVDGTAFTGAAGAAAAYIRVTDGSIAQFNKGDVLEIRDATTTTQVNVEMTVNSVIHGKDGPWSAGSRVADIGPGIIATPNTATTATWNAVDTPIATDILARSGEYHATSTSYRNIHGFPDWWNTAVDVFRDEDGGSVLDREAAGNHWMNPEQVTVAASGSEVNLDIDTHFRDIEDILPYRIETGRVKRAASVRNGPSLPESLVAFMNAPLVNEAVHTVGGSERFTTTLAMNLDTAKRRQLFGESGFDGYVYHSATLGEVCFQADVAMPPYVMYVIEPQSFFYVTFGGSPSGLAWLKNAGSRWQPVQGDTLGTPTFVQQAGAYTFMALACDQIGANFRITGVKSSREPQA